MLVLACPGGLPHSILLVFRCRLMDECWKTPGLSIGGVDLDLQSHASRLRRLVAPRRQAQDFEGVLQWGLGISGNGCYRAFILTSPTRPVIDVQTS